MSLEGIDISCPICLDILKIPKVLPCAHTFCLACLEKIEPNDNQSIACPLCREEHGIPNGNFSEFRNDLSMNKVLEQLQKEKDSGNSSGDGFIGRLNNSIRGSLRQWTVGRGALDVEEIKEEMKRKIDESPYSKKMEYSIIHQAAVMNKPTELKKILQNTGSEMSVDSPDKYGFTALHRASYCGFLDCVKLLLKFGAKVNVPNDFGGTAILYAAMGGHFEIMEKLAQNKADLQVTDTCGRNAYDYADSFGMKTHEITESCKEFFTKNGLSGTPSADSQINYDSNLTKCFDPKHLMACGASKDLNEWGPLHYAVRFSNQDVVSDLVKEGLPLDTRTKSGYNLLHLAAVNKNIAILNFVLETMRSRHIPLRVYMDERDANNSSPIHLASAKGNVHIIEALFELGCDQTLVDNNGNNALHVAVQNRHENMVKFLVNIKDLKKIKNNFGFTPKDFAKSIGDDKIQELFRSPLKRVFSMLRRQ